MIDSEKTFTRYGYEVKSLSRTSNLPVWWRCDKCSLEREYAFAYCLKKEEYAKNHNQGGEYCQKCSHEHRKGKATVKKVQGQSWQSLPPEVDVEGTIKRYGYDPLKLSPWSRKLVLVRCFKTGELFEVRRCGFNTSKSVIETGHYISVAGCTGDRRKGVKVSEETKKLMAEAQKTRRQREKEENEEPLLKTANG